MSAAGWRDARSVLCIRLDSLGDVLMCTPAMRAIKQSRQGRMLTLLTSAAGAAAAPYIPEVDAVIAHAAPWMKGGPGPQARDPGGPAALSGPARLARSAAQVARDAAAQGHAAPQGDAAAQGHAAAEGHAPAERDDAAEPAKPVGLANPANLAGLAVLADPAELASLLAARRFDAAVIFSSYSQSALPAAMLCQQAGIALTLAHCRENPYRLLSHWVPDPEPDTLVRHEVRRQLDLVASVGYRAGHLRLSFAAREDDIGTVRRLLAGCGIGAHAPWILMHPGASAASRRYPAARWSEVICELGERTGCPVVLTGDASERALIDGIRTACGGAVHSLAGQLDLGQLGAAIKLATVVVSNNTGPAHIAAALGTPLADLYALTNPQHTPWQVDSRLLFHDVPCRFCYRSVCPQGHQDCLAKVAPARVVDAVCSLMAASLHA